MKYLILLVLFIGCIDNREIIKSQSSQENNIKLYSGGKLIEEWNSIGKVENGSNAHYFKDNKTGKWITITGDIVIVEEKGIYNVKH